MDFRWNDWNIEHVQEHGVALREAELIIERAPEHQWLNRGDGKWLIRGRGYGDRFIQVILVLDEDGTLYVIHARPMTDKEKRQWRKTQE